MSEKPSKTPPLRQMQTEKQGIPSWTKEEKQSKANRYMSGG